MNQPSNPKNMIVRGAKEVTVAGPVTHWEVGEFEPSPGKKTYGVRISYQDPNTQGIASEVVEVPAHSTNVNVHPKVIPPEYRAALTQAI